MKLSTIYSISILYIYSYASKHIYIHEHYYDQFESRFCDMVEILNNWPSADYPELLEQKFERANASATVSFSMCPYYKMIF